MNPLEPSPSAVIRWNDLEPVTTPPHRTGVQGVNATALAPFLQRFDWDELSHCMHCGFCLPTCPTYQQTGLESHSPRGRIQLMKAVALGQLELDEDFAQTVDECLACRACETACPAGVHYGELVENARDILQRVRDSGLHPLLRRSHRFVRHVVFQELFNRPERMQTVGKLLWIAQVTGLQTLANKTGLVAVLPRGMRQLQKITGKVASPLLRRERQTVTPAEGNTRVRVAMFTGCVMDAVFYAINQATVRVLQKAGCEVVILSEQVCCGAMHAHSGELAGAKELAKQNIAMWERSGLDFLVNNAGGCGAALKEYAHWFREDDEWHLRAEAFVAHVKDASELLVDLPPLPFVREVQARVTYQDSCHLAHGQGVRKQPRDLIQSVPGVNYVEMARADSCCGSAGVYNITHPDMSMAILDKKMGDVQTTEADILITANPGCLMQMRLGVERAGLQNRMEVLHLMELLDRAL